MPTIGPNLDFHKAAAVAEIIKHTGDVRLSYATDGPFQAVAYELKRDEAAAYLALDPPPADLTGFPLLEGITALRGMTPFDLAKLWLKTNDGWTPILTATEVVRDGAVFAVKSATTRAGIDAALAQFHADMAPFS